MECCFLGAEGEEKLSLGVPLEEVGEEGGSLHVWQSTLVVDFPPCLLLLLLDPRRDGGVAGRQDGGMKACARIEFGKFNFASDFDRCRFYLRRLSTTIYNVLFVSTVFDLFPGVRSVCQARFFGCLRFQPIIAQFYAIVILNCFNLADTNMNSNDRCRLLCRDCPCPSHSYAVPLTALSASSDTVAVTVAFFL